jgi:hypothetical protein
VCARIKLLPDVGFDCNKKNILLAGLYIPAAICQRCQPMYSQALLCSCKLRQSAEAHATQPRNQEARSLPRGAHEPSWTRESPTCDVCPPASKTQLHE